MTAPGAALGLPLVLAMAAVSWLLRAGFVMLLPACRMPASLRAALEHLPASILAALVAVELTGAVDDAGSLDGSLAVIAATCLLGVAAWRTRSVALVSLLALVAVAGADLVPW